MKGFSGLNTLLESLNKPETSMTNISKIEISNGFTGTSWWEQVWW